MRNCCNKRRMLFAIQYQTGSDSFLSLEEIRAKLPKSYWRHSRVFEDVGVAVEMGMTPTYFWTLPDNDKAYLVAYQRAKATIQGYEQYLAERESKRKHKGGK